MPVKIDLEKLKDADTKTRFKSLLSKMAKDYPQYFDGTETTLSFDENILVENGKQVLGEYLEDDEAITIYNAEFGNTKQLHRLRRSILHDLYHANKKNRAPVNNFDSPELNTLKQKAASLDFDSALNGTISTEELLATIVPGFDMGDKGHFDTEGEKIKQLRESNPLLVDSLVQRNRINIQQNPVQSFVDRIVDLFDKP